MERTGTAGDGYPGYHSDQARGLPERAPPNNWGSRASGPPDAASLESGVPPLIIAEIGEIPGKFAGHFQDFLSQILILPGGMIGTIKQGIPRAGEVEVILFPCFQEETARAFAGFLKDCHAGVAPLRGLALIPMVGMVGAAVD